MLLAVCCGTGAQLMCTSILIVSLAYFGFMHSSRRGHLLLGMLWSFALMGFVNGFVTARLYKIMRGTSWKQAANATALGFPGMVFSFFFVANMIAVAHGSTQAVPLSVMAFLLFLWFGVSIPLVRLGAHLGFKGEAMEFPVSTSNIRRQVPVQPWFLEIPFVFLTVGVLPFGCIYIEFYFIMHSIWMGYFYSVYGVLLVVLLIMIALCGEIAMLHTYLQLCHDDHQWWWRSFLAGGSVAVYVILYAIFFFDRGNYSLVDYFLFFGYMSLISSGLFAMTGFLGFVTSLWLNLTVFGFIQID